MGPWLQLGTPWLYKGPNYGSLIILGTQLWVLDYNKDPTVGPWWQQETQLWVLDYNLGPNYGSLITITTMAP